jgi:hypothetical protein
VFIVGPWQAAKITAINAALRVVNAAFAAENRTVMVNKFKGLPFKS